MTIATEPTVFTAGDAVQGADNVIHAVAHTTERGNVATVCGIALHHKTVSPVLAPDPTAMVCGACVGQPQPEAPDEPPTEPETAVESPAQELADQQPEQLAETEPDQDAEGASSDGATSTTTRIVIANQPRLADIAAGKVGHFELIEQRQAGESVYALRGPDGKLLRDGPGKAYRFTDRSDAAWYAQRRYRLAQYEGFGGTKKLFMPKVARKVTSDWGVEFEIQGDLGNVQVLRDGQPVGPTWTHPTNGLVDAMRYAERLGRQASA